jgi:hypothetical protein
MSRNRARLPSGDCARHPWRWGLSPCRIPLCDPLAPLSFPLASLLPQQDPLESDSTIAAARDCPRKEGARNQEEQEGPQTAGGSSGVKRAHRWRPGRQWRCARSSSSAGHGAACRRRRSSALRSLRRSGKEPGSPERGRAGDPEATVISLLRTRTCARSARGASPSGPEGPCSSPCAFAASAARRRRCGWRRSDAGAGEGGKGK